MEKAVYSAVLTPFKKDLTIDTKLFISHCEFLLKNNISLAPLGTTGEANSISISEKLDLIKTIANSDLPKEKIIIGTGNTSFVDAALLTKTAVENKIYSVYYFRRFIIKMFRMRVFTNITKKLLIQSNQQIFVCFYIIFHR